MFKIGDKIVCIDEGPSYQSLTKGKTYIVINIYNNSVIIINDNNESDWFCSYRFKILEENNVFKKGDKVVCVNECSSYWPPEITKNKIYHVLEDEKDGLIPIRGDSGSNSLFNTYLFKKYKEPYKNLSVESKIIDHLEEINRKLEECLIKISDIKFSSSTILEKQISQCVCECPCHTLIKLRPHGCILCACSH